MDMSISTYAELQTSIINRSHRSDLASRIPEYIQIAEGRFNRELGEITKQLTRSTAPTVAGTAYVTLPDDFLTVNTIQLNETYATPLEYLTPRALDNRYGISSTSKPQAYTILGDELQLGPIPDAIYTLEIAYYAKVPALSDTNTTNWLLTLAPDMYLYGALYELYDDINYDKKAAASFNKYRDILRELRRMDRKRAAGDNLAVSRG